MTSLIRSTLLRQELHISQDLKERIFIGPQQGKIKILTQHLSQSCSWAYLSLHLCAFETVSCSFKRFHWHLSHCFQAVRPRFFPRLLINKIHTMIETWSVEKLFRVCNLLLLLFIFNIHLHLQKWLVQDLCKCRVVAFLKEKIENQ